MPPTQRHITYHVAVLRGFWALRVLGWRSSFSLSFSSRRCLGLRGVRLRLCLLLRVFAGVDFSNYHFRRFWLHWSRIWFHLQLLLLLLLNNDVKLTSDESWTSRSVIWIFKHAYYFNSANINVWRDGHKNASKIVWKMIEVKWFVKRFELVKYSNTRLLDRWLFAKSPIWA